MTAPQDSQRTQTQNRDLPGAGRVLVVEDESTIRETLEVLITIEGCDARSCGDGKSALALVRTWPPDLILLDYSLPGMTGDEFIRAYHQTPEPHAPIILLTGRRMELADATAMGATGVLHKPFEVTDLLDVVASFTDCADS
jgi:CheY-like chemotaxis protein